MFTIYSKQSCPNCDKAELLCKLNRVSVERVEVSSPDEVPNGSRTLPVIYHDGKLVGGLQDLNKYIKLL